MNSAKEVFCHLVDVAQTSANARYADAQRQFASVMGRPTNGVSAEDSARRGRETLLDPCLRQAVDRALASADQLPKMEGDYIKAVNQTIRVFSTFDDLVERESSVTSAAMKHLYAVERNPDVRFADVTDSVQAVLDIAIEKADRLGRVWPNLEPYDRLMRLWGGGTWVEFSQLAEPMLAKAPVIRDLTQAKNSLPRMKFRVPRADQERIAVQLLRQSGFDFSRGQIAFCPRGKCRRLGPQNICLGLEINEDHLGRLLFLAQHEGGGHGWDFQNRPLWFMEGLIYELIEDFRYMETWGLMASNYVPLDIEYWNSACRTVLAGVNTTPQQLWAARNELRFSPEWGEAGAVTTTLHMILQSRGERLLVMGQVRVEELEDWYGHQLDWLFGQRPVNMNNHLFHWGALSQGSYGLYPGYADAECGAAMLYRKFIESDPNYLESLRAGRFGYYGEILQAKIGHGFLMDYRQLMTEVVGGLTADAWIDITLARASMSYV